MGRADRTLAYFSLSDFFGLFCAFVASLPNRMSNNQVLALVVIAFVTYIYYDVGFTNQRRHIERKEDKADETSQKVKNLINNDNKPTVADPVLASILEAVNKLTAQVEATSQKVDSIEAQSKALTADTSITSTLSGLDRKLGMMDSKVEIIQRDIVTLKKKDDMLPVEDTKISEVLHTVHQLGENVVSVSQDVYRLKEKVDKPPVKEDTSISVVLDIVRSLEKKVNTVSQEVVTLKGMNNTPAIKSLIVTHLDELKSKLDRDLHVSFEKVNSKIDTAERRFLDRDRYIPAISDSVCRFEGKLDIADNRATANADFIRNALDQVNKEITNDFAEVNKNVSILTKKASDDEADASLFKEAFGMLFEKVETIGKDLVTLLVKEVTSKTTIHEQIAEADRNVHGHDDAIENLKRQMNNVLKELEDEKAKVTAAEQYRQAAEKKLADKEAEMRDSLIKEMKKNDAVHRVIKKAGIDVHLYTMPAMRPDRERETVYYTTLQAASEEQDTELYDMPTRPRSEESNTGSGDFDDFVSDPEVYDEDVPEGFPEFPATEDVDLKAVKPVIAKLSKDVESFVPQSFTPATHPKNEADKDSQGEENHIAAVIKGVRRSAEPTIQLPLPASAVPRAQERVKQSAPENKQGVKACRNCGDWWPTKDFEAFKAHYRTCGETICRSCDLVVSKKYIQAHLMYCRQRTHDEREAYIEQNIGLPSIARTPDIPTQRTNTTQPAYTTTSVTNTTTTPNNIAKAAMSVSNRGVLGGSRWSTPILAGSNNSLGLETPRNPPPTPMGTHAFARNQAPQSNNNPDRGSNNQVSSNGGPRPSKSPSASTYNGPRPFMPSFKGNGFRPAPSEDVPQFTGNKIFDQDPKYEEPSAENKKE